MEKHKFPQAVCSLNQDDDYTINVLVDGQPILRCVPIEEATHFAGHFNNLNAYVKLADLAAMTSQMAAKGLNGEVIKQVVTNITRIMAGLRACAEGVPPSMVTHSIDELDEAADKLLTLLEKLVRESTNTLSEKPTERV